MTTTRVSFQFDLDALNDNYDLLGADYDEVERYFEGLLDIEATVSGGAETRYEPSYLDVDITKATFDGVDVLDWLGPFSLMELIDSAAVTAADEQCCLLIHYR